MPEMGATMSVLASMSATRAEVRPGLCDPALCGLAHLLQAPDSCLGAADLGRRGVGSGRGAIELGHRHEAVLAKVPRPLQLELRLVRAGLRRVEIGLRRLQEVGCRPQVGLGALDPRIRGRRARRRLDGVDARHDLSGLDGVALFHAEFDQAAHDTGPDVRVPLGDDLPEAVTTERKTGLRAAGCVSTATPPPPRRTTKTAPTMMIPAVAISPTVRRFIGLTLPRASAAPLAWTPAAWLRIPTRAAGVFPKASAHGCFGYSGEAGFGPS